MYYHVLFIQQTNGVSQAHLSSYSSADGCIDLSCKHRPALPTCEHLASIDLSLTRFFYSCGIQFNTVENPIFINFVSKLNQNYKLPSNASLANSLVDDVCLRVKKDEAAVWLPSYQQEVPLNLCQSSHSKNLENQVTKQEYGMDQS